MTGQNTAYENITHCHHIKNKTSPNGYRHSSDRVTIKSRNDRFETGFAVGKHAHRAQSLEFRLSGKDALLRWIIAIAVHIPTNRMRIDTEFLQKDRDDTAGFQSLNNTQTHPDLFTLMITRSGTS